MKRSGVILYGPPASGKDTDTAALSQLDPRYVLFDKLKVGTGQNGYRVAPLAELERLRREGLVIYENERYGNIYVVDCPALDQVFARGLIPVVHMGQVAGVRALMRYPADWLSVLLWCPRNVTEQRAIARGSTDVPARLTAWDETLVDIEQRQRSDFALNIHTDEHDPLDVAKVIHAQLAALNQET